MYNVKLLPVARKDLKNIIIYITNVLKNPIAAENLRKSFEEKFELFKEFPLTYAEYQFKQAVDFEYSYRMAPVKNFAVFYVLIDNTVEIHRIIYAKMDFNKQFEKPVVS